MNVKSLEINIDNFVNTLSDELISINDLVELYNNYFGTKVNNGGISKIKGLKDHFVTSRPTINGKRITCYQKIRLD